MISRQNENAKMVVIQSMGMVDTQGNRIWHHVNAIALRRSIVDTDLIKGYKYVANEVATIANNTTMKDTLAR